MEKKRISLTNVPPDFISLSSSRGDARQSGTYRLFADHQPMGRSPGLATGKLVIAGDDEPAATLTPDNSVNVTVGEIKAHGAMKTGDQETTVQFNPVDLAGKTVTDREPYFGAMGHLAFIIADGRNYVNVHPLSEARTAPDGAIEFTAHSPKPRIDKAWDEFQRGGSVFTVQFVSEHKGTKSK